MFRNIHRLYQTGKKYSNFQYVKNDHAHFYSSITNIEQRVMQPIYYLEKSSEEFTEFKLLNAYNHWLKIPAEKLTKVKEIIKLCLHATNALDDIFDDSLLRYTIPSSHYVFGKALTVNASLCAYFQALVNMSNFGHHRAVLIGLSNLLKVHEGQGMEEIWKTYSICPTEEEYKDMVNKRLNLMQLVSTNLRDLSKYLDLFSILSQIHDDYNDILHPKILENSDHYGDFVEGKFTFPIIHSIRSNLNDRTLINILSKKPKDKIIQNYLITLLEKSGSFEYTRNAFNRLYSELVEEIRALGGNDDMMTMLGEMKQDMNNR